MLYPIYVHQEEGSAYGVTFPDFPGCFAAADEAQGIAAAAQEAFEAHFHNDGDSVPPPSDLGQLMRDPEYSDGSWMQVEIDVNKVSTKAVRLNITLPENVLHQIDAAAHARHMSRSAFLQQSALKEIQNREWQRPSGGRTDAQRV